MVNLSTTVRIVLQPLDSGKSVTKSRLQEWNLLGGIGKGYKAPGARAVESFVRAQTSHALQNAATD